MEIMAESIGIDKEALVNTSITYTTNPTERWKSGIKVYFDAIANLGKFEGRFKDKEFEEIAEEIFCFDAVNQLHK